MRGRRSPSPGARRPHVGPSRAGAWATQALLGGSLPFRLWTPPLPYSTEATSSGSHPETFIKHASVFVFQLEIFSENGNSPRNHPSSVGGLQGDPFKELESLSKNQHFLQKSLKPFQVLFPIRKEITIIMGL